MHYRFLPYSIIKPCSCHLSSKAFFTKIMTYHIIPINDIDEHEESTRCKCNPEIDFEHGNMIVIHKSFDKREYVEMLTDPDFICPN